MANTEEMNDATAILRPAAETDLPVINGIYNLDVTYMELIL